ncbi:MAG: hypothetical protein MUF49_17740 [Oculatellaceae cyanobacterium Prado106]|jgi:hypothetical protein|nr:hypothetical protein [Oculatellaceae cyanobacterium Prado106]
MGKAVDEALSLELATKIKSKAKAQFDNAYRAALATEGALYVQGFLVVAGNPAKPLEHAWIEVGDTILDPTLPHLKQKPQNLHYFPAQPLTVKKLKAIVEEAKEDYPEDDPLPVYGSSPYEYYGNVMLGGKEYQEALKLAEAKCREIKQQQSERN